MSFSVFIAQPWFISVLFGNTLYMLAVGYYIYITFLGYNCKFSKIINSFELD